MSRPGKRSGLSEPRRFQWLKELLVVVVLALTLSSITKHFIIQQYVIPSGSMEQTLQIGDRVAVQKLNTFQRGDVIVFRDDLGWLGSTVPATPAQQALEFLGLSDQVNNYVIKRVIGMPGDRVTCCDSNGRVTVNGVALDETGYLYTDPRTSTQVAPSDYEFDVVVPRGRVFVMGDHRDDSLDSRCHLGDYQGTSRQAETAFIPIASISGSAVYITFPFERLASLPLPATFANIPGAKAAPPIDPIVRGSIPQC